MSSSAPARRKTPVTRRSLLAGSGALVAACAAGVGYLATRKGAAIGADSVRARPVASEEVLPAAVEVVILGGGNIGCLTALCLAERGVKVALCEKGAIAGEASGRSLGWVDSQLVDLPKYEIVARSKRLWAELNARLGAETGFRQTGTGALFTDSEGVQFADAWVTAVKGQTDSDARVLGSRDAAKLAPGATDKFTGALYIPSDGCAEPQLAAAAVAERVQQLGGHILQRCAVRGIEHTAGAVSGVVTEKGRIACTAVVVAGGIWSPIFLQSIGLDLPQVMAFGTCMRYAAAPAPTTSVVLPNRNLVLRRGLDGTIDACKPVATVPITPAGIKHAWQLRTALKHMWDQLDPALNFATFGAFLSMPTRWALDSPSPFEQYRSFSPEVNPALIDYVSKTMTSAFPQIGQSRVIDQWSGAMMTTVDNKPVISSVPGHRGLFIGSGFYYGLTMAPAAGEALADLVMGTTPKIKLDLYRFSRFTDGSPLVFSD